MQPCGPMAGGEGRGVVTGHHHPADPSQDKAFRARDPARRTLGAGLQGHVSRCATGVFPRLAEGDFLGVRTASRAGHPLADHAIVLNDHASHRRIVAGQADIPGGQGDGAAHGGEVGVGRLHAPIVARPAAGAQAPGN